MTTSVRDSESSSPKAPWRLGHQEDSIIGSWEEWYRAKYTAYGWLGSDILVAWGAEERDIEASRFVWTFTGHVSYGATTGYCEEDTDRALDQFVADVSRIPQVVRVEFLQDDEGIDIWTSIEERDVTVRSKIHECQIRLLERYPSLMVDFHVVTNPQGSFYGTKQIYSRTQ